MRSRTAIEACGVDKSYGERFRPALQQVTFTVSEGEVLGIIGPNGAGKTTTLLIVSGLLRPSAGSVRVLGKQVRAGIGDPRIGLVSGSLGDFDFLTGGESVLLAGRLLGLSGAEAGRRADELLAAFDLQGAADKLITSYSSGMKQKVRICCALIGSPSVLLLDEPFEALDIAASAVLSEIVRRLAAAGAAVLLASHDLRLVEKLATHYAILQAGRLQETADMASLGAGEGVCADRPRLEQRFWEVTGAPVIPELAWLKPACV